MAAILSHHAAVVSKKEKEKKGKKLDTKKGGAGKDKERVYMKTLHLYSLLSYKVLCTYIVYAGS